MIKIKNKKNSFTKNIIIIMFSQALIKIIGFVYKIYLTNKSGYGDAGNAIYNSAFQIYALFLTICSIGVPNAIAKLISSKEAIGDIKVSYRILKISLVLFGVLGFIGSSILFWKAKYIANNYLQLPDTKYVLMVLAPSIFLVSISSVMKGYFNGKKQLNITANSGSAEQIVKTVLTIVLVEIVANWSKNNTNLMVETATIAATLATLSGVIYLYLCFLKEKRQIWKEVKKSIFSKEERCKQIIKDILYISVPIALSSLFAGTSKTIDALTIVRILKKNMPEEYAKLQYGILSGKVDALISLPFAFNIAFSTALVPTVSTSIAIGNKRDAKKKIKSSVIFSLLIGIICTTIIMFFSSQIIRNFISKCI